MKTYVKYDEVRKRNIIEYPCSKKLRLQSFGDAQYRYYMNKKANREKKSYEDSMPIGYDGACFENAVSEYFYIKHESRRLNEIDFNIWNYCIKLPDVGLFECKSSRNSDQKLKIPIKYDDDDIVIFGIVDGLPKWNDSFSSEDYMIKIVGWLCVSDCRVRGNLHLGEISVSQHKLKKVDELVKIRQYMFSKNGGRSVRWRNDARYIKWQKHLDRLKIVRGVL
jgi:hypothetical protein